MSNRKDKPILFVEPVFKQMIWGGNRLAAEYGYPIPGDDTGECWAVSARDNGDCVIKEGIYEGKTLSELWKEQPELFGDSELDRFPLLVKIIAAKADLSIQVHPDDAYAKEHENGSWGKTETWYILDCLENTSLVVGHNAKDKQELSDMIREGRWNELLREVPVKKGDLVQIDPGTVHVIKKGMLILETQQNSDITYRVYDYDRKTNGKLRPLHVKESIDVITVPARPVEECMKSVLELPVNRMNELISCAYYTVWKLQVREQFSMEQTHPFLIMSVVAGEGTIDGHKIKKGDHFILPAGYGKVELQGDMELIASSVN